MRIAQTSEKSIEGIKRKWSDLVHGLFGLYFLDPVVKPRDDGLRFTGDFFIDTMKNVYEAVILNPQLGLKHFGLYY